MSRTSSMSASRSNVPRRAKNNKQRRDDSDSFDSRYEYTPYWGGPQQQMWIPQQQMANQYAPPMAAGFAGQVQLPPQAPMSYAQYPIVPPGVHGAVHAGSGASYPIAQVCSLGCCVLNVTPVLMVQICSTHPISTNLNIHQAAVHSVGTVVLPK